MCAWLTREPPSILGISFDGLGISGIVNEFVKVANVLRGENYRVLLDLGYDITLGKTRDLGRNYLPSWINTIRAIRDQPPSAYSKDLIEEARNRVADGTSIAALKIYDDVCGQLAASLLATFERENVRILIVENGTLPDNPLFTEAVYLAVAEYGTRQKLGKYVLWRDHDLMWSVEPRLYGSYPYPGVRKPDNNKHVHFVVTSEWMRTRVRAWAPGVTCHVIPYRFFPPVGTHSSRSLRSSYGIPEDAYLIARCTRVVPQKSIERDLWAFHEIQLRLAASGNQRKIFLFIAGPTDENPDEFQRLRAIEQRVSIAGQVIWGDGLLPLNNSIINPTAKGNRFSIRDLLADANLSSFLTTYNYEGFGMPPGEAMALGVPFVATTYELYQDVYGDKGVIAPLLPIDQASSPRDPIPESFLTWTRRLLIDDAYREQIGTRNLDIVRRFFSMDSLAKQLTEIFASSPDLVDLTAPEEAH